MKKHARVGIWGCKHGIKGHGVIIKHIHGVRLAALCDNNLQALHIATQIIGEPIECFTNPKDMFPHIDAVIIATRDADHIDHLRMAIEHNLHVLIEKPIAITEDGMREFQKLLQVAQAKSLAVTSCHPRRFDPPFIWLKKNLEKLKRRLGSVTGFHYDFTYHKPHAGWKQFNRSLLLDHHGHEIDLVNFLFGHQQFTENIHDDSPDRYLVTGKRADGIGFSFHGTRRMEERVFHEWMTVRFANGSVTVNTSTGIATVINKRTEVMSDSNCGATDYKVRSIGVTKNFIDTIAGKASNYLTVEDMILNNLSGIRLLKYGIFDTRHPALN